MANEEHLKILNQGVEAWNRWRARTLQRNPDLIRAKLAGAQLSHADLGGSLLSQSDLSGARLIGADLSGADLKGADLTDAALSDALLLSVNLSGAGLHNTDFANSQIEYVVFAGADLSTTKGLNSLYHSGPSYISIDTLYKSGGKIPEAFLRGCGVPDEFIIYARSL